MERCELSHWLHVITFRITLHCLPNEFSVYAHTGYCLVNIMKDIRFWRAEYLGDVIGYDQSNKSSKRNALGAARSAAGKEWIFLFPQNKA